jgi:hypothetical protein
MSNRYDEFLTADAWAPNVGHRVQLKLVGAKPKRRKAHALQNLAEWASG